MLYLLSLITSFCAVFLKGFQHKNVIGNHIKAVFYTSFAMAAFDVAAITIVVKGDMSIAFSAGLGAALGMVSSIKFHDKIFKTGKNKMAIQLSDDEIHYQATAAALHLTSGFYRFQPGLLKRKTENGGEYIETVLFAINGQEEERIWKYIDSLPGPVRDQVAERFGRLKERVTPSPEDLIPTPVTFDNIRKPKECHEG